MIYLSIIHSNHGLFSLLHFSKLISLDDFFGKKIVIQNCTNMCLKTVLTHRSKNCSNCASLLGKHNYSFHMRSRVELHAEGEVCFIFFGEEHLRFHNCASRESTTVLHFLWKHRSTTVFQANTHLCFTFWGSTIVLSCEKHNYAFTRKHNCAPRSKITFF